MNIGNESGAIAATLAGLFVFGVLFNWFVGWANQKGYNEGYTAVMVVFGVGVTIFFFGLAAGWESVPLLVACFAASGAPMLIGDIARHIQARVRTQRRLAGLDD